MATYLFLLFIFVMITTERTDASASMATIIKLLMALSRAVVRKNRNTKK